MIVVQSCCAPRVCRSSVVRMKSSGAQPRRGQAVRNFAESPSA